MDENPVEMNLTPAINIIFCLIVFFMSCFKFKALEGKVDSWLPQTEGIRAAAPPEILLEDIRVRMWWDEGAQRTLRRVNQSDAAGDADLQALLAQRKASFAELGRTGVPVALEAGPDVPWRDVVRTLDLCRRERFERIEFSAPRTEGPAH